MIPISILTPHSPGSKRASLARDMVKDLYERRVDIGSKTKLAGRLSASLSDSKNKRTPMAANKMRRDWERSVNTNINEASVDLMFDSNSETDPRRNSFDGSTTDNIGASSGEEDLWLNIAVEGNRSLYFCERKKNHEDRHARTSLITTNSNQSTISSTSLEARNDSSETQRVPLKGRLQSFSLKISPSGPSLNSTWNSNILGEEHREAEIYRQAPLILNDTYQAIMYGSDSHKRKDYFAPYAKNNRKKMMSNTQMNSESLLRDSQRKSKSFKIFPKAKKETLPMKKRRRQKYQKRNLVRMQKRIYQMRNIKGNYYSNFLHITGRVEPKHSILLLVGWTTIVLVLHRNYIGFKLFGLDMSLEIPSNAPLYLGIALGYLLYMQASISSRRWWQGRIEWQRLMSNNQLLAIEVNTKLHFPRLTKFGSRLILAHTISVWCFLQDKDDEGWYRELSNILDKKTIARIMINSRRLRPLAILYAFQRIFEICVINGILQREVLRDINPILLRLSTSFDACNRSRIAQFPWIMAIHLSFVVFIYLVLLPLTFVNVSVRDSNYNNVAIEQYRLSAIWIYVYVIFLSYAYMGLYQMAVVIEDPFSFKREHHSFGVWGLWEYWTALQISDVRHIFGFHVRRIVEEGRNSYGAWGENWAVEKLDPLILKAIRRGILNHSDKVLASMQTKCFGQSFFDLFSQDIRDGSSSISLSTTSDDNKNEVEVINASSDIQRIYECPAGYVSTPCHSSSS